eukprot:CAMPEP_0182839540 /NCGR_PEP_ID=MMETSP0006_2-20121128/23919_1 /TAXON_ID=97485 /ORGANISM="Prymnesium parvum, Strain Texoma1" /LENGTH=280 /DNA_ID=CAMNT_0024968693 /DNA_START=132 /DNA_END=971 /DNA_ORIENTATION=-
MSSPVCVTSVRDPRMNILGRWWRHAHGHIQYALDIEKASPEASALAHTGQEVVRERARDGVLRQLLLQPFARFNQPWAHPGLGLEHAPLHERRRLWPRAETIAHGTGDESLLQVGLARGHQRTHPRLRLEHSALDEQRWVRPRTEPVAHRAADERFVKALAPLDHHQRCAGLGLQHAKREHLGARGPRAQRIVEIVGAQVGRAQLPQLCAARAQRRDPLRPVGLEAEDAHTLSQHVLRLVDERGAATVLGSAGSADSAPRLAARSLLAPRRALRPPIPPP